MYLIVGLGNPGLAYAYTRHNVGFLFVDHLAYDLGFPNFKAKFNSLYTEKTVNNEKVLIQKPQTFMNRSGAAVSQIVSFYKIPVENIFVVHDDIDLPPLEVKIKFGGSNGGHNGLRDIDKSLGNQYWRIRIGVGRPIEKSQVADYVLSPFYNDEIKNMLPKVFDSLISEFSELLVSEDKSKIIGKVIQEIKNK